MLRGFLHLLLCICLLGLARWLLGLRLRGVPGAVRHRCRGVRGVPGSGWAKTVRHRRSVSCFGWVKAGPWLPTAWVSTPHHSRRRRYRNRSEERRRARRARCGGRNGRASVGPFGLNALGSAGPSPSPRHGAGRLSHLDPCGAVATAHQREMHDPAAFHGRRRCRRHDDRERLPSPSQAPACGRTWPHPCGVNYEPAPRAGRAFCPALAPGPNIHHAVYVRMQLRTAQFTRSG